MNADCGIMSAANPGENREFLVKIGARYVFRVARRVIIWVVAELGNAVVWEKCNFEY